MGSNYGSTHPQVAVTVSFCVDEKMKDLIAALWSKGFMTEHSCQGGKEDPLNPSANIVFPSLPDAIVVSWILENANIPHVLATRGFIFGGGAAIDFDHISIPNFLQAVLDYKSTPLSREERDKLFNEIEAYIPIMAMDGWSTIKVYGSPSFIT